MTTNKSKRLDSIKMIISSKEIGSQEELLQELAKEVYELTQATLKQLFLTTYLFTRDNHFYRI